MQNQEYNPRIITAIKKSKELADMILEEHPEIVTDYLIGELTHLQLAEKYVPEQLTRYPRVTLSAISNLMREALPEQTREPLRKRHVRDILPNWIKTLDKKALEEFLRKSKAGRNEKDKGNEGNTEGLFKHNQTIPWNDPQNKYFLQLLENPQYRWQKGAKRGYLHYETIVQAIKDKFGITRSKSAIDNKIRDLLEAGYSINRKLEIIV